LLSGVDLSGADDQVTDVLLDLARLETQPRTEAMARALVDGMAQTGGPMNRRPLRAASFSVLKAADIPSVLIEIGFMSSPRDLKNLSDPAWRAGLARGIANGLLAWRQDDAAQRALVRQ
jgi:N-acetylmuramoyl-L-alanine amidase